MKFGQYFIPIKNPQIGQQIWLDGIDGFNDQSLSNMKKGDKINFIINPSLSLSLLNQTYIESTVLANVISETEAHIRIDSVKTLEFLFNNKLKKPISFLQICSECSDIWNSIIKTKLQYPNYRYQNMYNHFLTFKELNRCTVDNDLDIIRYKNDIQSRVIAKRNSSDSVRVMSVTANTPYSCVLYNIDNYSLYHKVIINLEAKSTLKDERGFWNSIITK